MIKGKKIIRNIVILVILAVFLFKMSGLYLTPLSAHESSERSMHYGPSEVLHTEDFGGGKYILCKYDKWVSCNTVKRKMFFFWKFGNQPIGFENDKNKAIDFSWGITQGRHKCYGIINDNQIKRVQATLESGRVFEITEFYDDLFLFTWETDTEADDHLVNMKGYDAGGTIIFEYNQDTY